MDTESLTQRPSLGHRSKDPPDARSWTSSINTSTWQRRAPPCWKKRAKIKNWGKQVSSSCPCWNGVSSGGSIPAKNRWFHPKSSLIRATEHSSHALNVVLPTWWAKFRRFPPKSPEEVDRANQAFVIEQCARGFRKNFREKYKTNGRLYHSFRKGDALKGH